jgi:hypothetical protein
MAWLKRKKGPTIDEMIAQGGPGFAAWLDEIDRATGGIAGTDARDTIEAAVRAGFFRWTGQALVSLDGTGALWRS